MAVKTFEETLASLQLSADEKKIFDSVLAKSPELKEGWLRQDDYSRKSTELQSRQKQFDELSAYEQRMKPWSEKVYAQLGSLQEAGILDDEGNETWSKTKTQLESELEAARKQALAGGDMKPEEIDARVREIVKAAGGGLTKDEITALYKQEAKSMVEAGFKAREDDFNQKTIPFIASFSSDVAVLASRYERETGEKWTQEHRNQLFGLMNEAKEFDPLKFEEKLLAPHKAKKDQEELIEAEVQKRLKKIMPEGGDERYIPHFDTNGQKGALQRMLDDQSKDQPLDIEALVKSKAVEAANSLRGEGKF